MDNHAYVKRTFAARADGYDDEFSWIHDKAFIEGLVPSPFGQGRYLDTCAGTGAVAEYACLQGWQVTATDISGEMLSKIKSEMNRVVADICQMPFENDSFDVVGCRQGLQYADLKGALTELYRVAKKEVRLAHITIFDAADLAFWTDYYRVASPGRVNVFLPGQIAELAKQIGYKTVKTHTKISEESYIAPIMYLPEAERDHLVRKLLSASPEFLLRNHITLGKDDIRSERRWEFSVLTK